MEKVQLFLMTECQKLNCHSQECINISQGNIVFWKQVTKIKETTFIKYFLGDDFLWELPIIDVTHFLRFRTPPSPLSPILLNRIMEIPLPLSK